MDIKIKLLEVFCFRFVMLSGLYDIWSPFSMPKTKIMLIDPRTAPRAQATGRGRGGVNPPQDWGLGDPLVHLHALTAPLPRRIFFALRVPDDRENRCKVS